MNIRALLLIISVGWCMQGLAQQDYFVFIRSENHQPFYVRMEERNLSSSSIGHIILSRLKDSTYTIVIGFPRNQFPEQEFNIAVKKDRGLELKNMGDKGWVLFDLHSMQLISPSGPVKQTSGVSLASYNLIKKNDDFARLMAGVVNDTAVLYTVVMQAPPDPVVAKKEETVVPKKEETVVPKPVEDTLKTKPVDVVITSRPVEDTARNKPVEAVVISKVQEDSTEKKAATGIPAKVVADTVSIVKDTVEKVMDPPALPVIKMVNAHATDSGYRMLVVDELKDTIDIFIQAEKAVSTDAPAKKEAPVKEVPVIVKDTVAAPAKQQVPGSKEEIKKPVAESTKSTSDSAKLEIKKPVVDSNKQETVKHVSDSTKPDAKPTVKTVKPETKQQVIDSNKPETVKHAPDSSRPDTNKSATETVRPETKQPDSTKPESKKLVMLNSDCRSFANDSDLDKLRLKLMQEKDAVSRINAAKKVFKTKCFSAQQIKALSELFPYDENKYSFLESAYPFVSDTGNFKELVSLLSDQVYIQRFRRLVRLD